MAQIYAALIRKGIKTIDDVPVELKDEVIRILNEDAGMQPHDVTSLLSAARGFKKEYPHLMLQATGLFWLN